MTSYSDLTYQNGQNYGTYGLGSVAPNTWRDISVALPPPSAQDPTIFPGFLIFVDYDGGAILPNPSRFYVDDIRLTEVPEPTTASLLAFGLLGTLAVRRQAR